MLQIDLAFTALAVGLIGSAAGAVAAFMRVFRRYDSLPDRVAKIEEDQKALNEKIDGCRFRNADLSKIQSALEDMTKKSENDYRMILQINRSQQIMMDGLCAIMDHQATGNHVEKMEEVKTEMMKEMIRSREEVLSYD